MAAIRTNAGFILHFEEEIAAGRLLASLDDMPKYIGRPSLTPESRWAGGDTGEPVYSDEAKLARLNELTNRVCKGEMLGDRENSEYLTLKKWGDEKLGDVRYVNGKSQYFVKWGGLSIPPNEAALSPKTGARYKVYLCGPITGNASDWLWRGTATRWFGRMGIDTLNPLRGKDPKAISDQGLRYKGQLASPEMGDRDSMDIQQADVILACFPYAPPRQSIGSLMEMGMAHAWSKPIVLCTSENVFRDHLFCRNFCDTITSDLTTACDRVLTLTKGAKRERIG
jgi:nucleoside 2-deoxyribosyltransferase